jgi:DtxR family Mn-dependent transcriptional regulator
MDNTNDDLSEALEDYLEVIYRIILKNSAVRVKDIAAELKVKNPSVTSALQALKKRALINYEPYGIITLTKAGLETALKTTEKHRLLKNFLSHVLGIQPSTANDTACRMEHVIPHDVYVKLVQFIKYLYVTQGDDGQWVAEFRAFAAKDSTRSVDSGNLEKYFHGTGFTIEGETDVTRNA